MNPLRVAVIGAGYWGPNLVRNLNEAPGAEPVAVADLSQERLDTIHKRFPAVRVTTDHTELFNDKNVDAVAIATPVGTHRRLAEQALAAGKHVFVEKPLAPTVADAEAIVRAAEKADRTLMVGHTFVYNPAVVTIRGLIESGELGRINYVDSQRVNLGLHQFDINVLWDLGPHDVSITLYWLGEEPEWVQCVGACYVQPDIEDVVFLTMGFPSGALAHLREMPHARGGSDDRIIGDDRGVGDDRACERGHARAASGVDRYETRAPPERRLRMPASRTRTTRRPASPSLRGRLPFCTHSTKCRISTWSASVIGTRGLRMSPAR